jgi:glyoxylase-like metal-dependent hydrolase (beta-lactamase superfamily II)
MVLRPFLYASGSCASYLFGCTTHGKLAVVDPHVDLVDAYVAAAVAIGSPITDVFETHVQADHVSGLPALVERQARPPSFRWVPASSSSTLRSPTATWSNSGTPSWRRSRRRDMPPLITPTLLLTDAGEQKSRGSCSPATRS